MISKRGPLESCSKITRCRAGSEKDLWQSVRKIQRIRGEATIILLATLFFHLIYINHGFTFSP